MRDLIVRYRLRNKEDSANGFTLMELVVVIGVMAILALVMVPNLTAYIQKADDSKNESNIRSVHISAEIAVRSNTEIRVKNLPILKNEVKLSLQKDIANYANLNINEVEIVANAEGEAHTAIGVYYLSPDITNQKIIVRYNTDRETYIFERYVSEEKLEGIDGYPPLNFILNDPKKEMKLKIYVKDGTLIVKIGVPAGRAGNISATVIGAEGFDKVYFNNGNEQAILANNNKYNFTITNGKSGQFFEIVDEERVPQRWDIIIETIQ